MSQTVPGWTCPVCKRYVGMAEQHNCQSFGLPNHNPVPVVLDQTDRLIAAIERLIAALEPLVADRVPTASAAKAVLKPKSPPRSSR